MKKVVIVGAGPAALFAAKTILEGTSALLVTILEQGNAPEKRSCPARKTPCQCCEVCDVISGGGGAGLFSDGKLVLDLESGGKAEGVDILTPKEKVELAEEIKKTMQSFDGISSFKGVPSSNEQSDIVNWLSLHDLQIKFYDVLHMGTYNLSGIIGRFIDYLKETYPTRFSIYYGTAVNGIFSTSSQHKLVTDHEVFYAEIVIAAVGKSGATWLRDVLGPGGAKSNDKEYFLGIRIETKASSITELTGFSYDPKIFRYDHGRKVKTHCVCRKGRIRFYRYQNALFVGGHSPYTEGNSQINNVLTANLNVFVSFDKQKKNPQKLIDAFKSFGEDAIMAQKLSDFINCTKTKTWGCLVPDIELAYHFGNIRDIFDAFDSEFSCILLNFLSSLSKICPGIMSGDNILYAPAIEWDMAEIKVDRNMETSTTNFFAIGDGTGLSQGIVYSAATGIIAANCICSRYEEGEK